MIKQLNLDSIKSWPFNRCFHKINEIIPNQNLRFSLLSNFNKNHI